MEIEALDKKTIKIILSKQDMINFSLTYEEMNYDDPTTKKVILKILNDVKEKNKVDLSNGKLFIEAFPDEDGGCILYLNVLSILKEDLSMQNGFGTPIIASISNPYHLFYLCKNLNNNYNNIILKSHLFIENNIFYLFIYPLYKKNDHICAIVNEFAKLKGKGELDSNFIKEHSTLLVEDNAIQKMASL